MNKYDEITYEQMVEWLKSQAPSCQEYYYYEDAKKCKQIFMKHKNNGKMFAVFQKSAIKKVMRKFEHDSDINAM
jgi:hypothetical protein